jgi:predicted acylesterase/phospholipase RssA
MSLYYWTLSFSGAGHLLPYHLGVATTLLRKLPPSFKIHSVAGSSAGAIAATVLGLLPHRIEEYTDRFLQDRGYAFRNLQQMLFEEQEQASETTNNRINIIDTPIHHDIRILDICTTKCSDGKMHLFSFDISSMNRHNNDDHNDRHHNNQQIDNILMAVKASCVIPKSFHPYDMFSNQHSISYPDEDGILIDGRYYVDGGIAAPIPPTSLCDDQNCLGRIEVSPISGPKPTTTTTPKNILSIRPNDTSMTLLPFTLATKRCQPFEIRPSVQNLRALVVSIGLARPEVLRDWYQRGTDDANEFLHTYDTNNINN